jgi:hypothetical protein
LLAAKPWRRIGGLIRAGVRQRAVGPHPRRPPARLSARRAPAGPGRGPPSLPMYNMDNQR